MDEAMRTADGNPVFVRGSGEYSDEFPEENICKRVLREDATAYIVYAFVGLNDDYEEQSFLFRQEEEALKFATNIYGMMPRVDQTRPLDYAQNVSINLAKAFHRSTGEVFEVEVHSVNDEMVMDAIFEGRQFNILEVY